MLRTPLISLNIILLNITLKLLAQLLKSHIFRIIPDNHPPSWFVIPTLAAYDELKLSLNKRGVREKALLANLNKEDERIRTAIRKMNYPSRQHRLIGNQEMTIKGLKKDVVTMDSSLGYAGLGGLDNITKHMKPGVYLVCTLSTSSNPALIMPRHSCNV